MNTILTETQSNDYQLGSNVIPMDRNPKTKEPVAKIIKLRTEIREPVQPIKDLSDIQKAKDYLFNKEGRYSVTNKRDYAIFVLMINIARRAGDVLNLKVDDILHKNGTFKTQVWIIPEKTKKTSHKQAVFSLSESAQEALRIYFNEHPEILQDKNNGLFPSRESENKSMSYSQLYRVFKDIENKINENKDDNDKLHIATHTPRKTWAVQTIIRNPNNQYVLAQVSKALNHDSEATTYHYLGFDTDTTVKLFQNNGL